MRSRCADPLGDAAGAVMFAHDKTRWRRTEQLEDAVELGVTVRRVDVAEVGGLGLGAGAAQPPAHVGADHAASFPASEAFGGLRDQRERLTVALDEGDRGGAARQRLESDRPGAGVQVDHPCADDPRPEDVEDRLTDHRASRTHLDPGWRAARPVRAMPRP